jgi:hypothetical protein
MARSFPAAAFRAAERSLLKDSVIVAELPTKSLMAVLGGTMKSSELDPDPHPMLMVPSLHWFKPAVIGGLQLRFGNFASCPITAIDLMLS